MFTKYLDPKNDFAFKKIFGEKKNKDVLITFLNDVLDHHHIGNIKEIEFLKTELLPDLATEKVSVVDILCTDDQGDHYIVEMQASQRANFTKRAQCYAAKAYVSQIQKGGKYKDLKAIIFLAIANFIIFKNKTAVKSDHVILDRKTGDQDLKDFSFTFIELPKFTKCLHELDTMFDKWCYFFVHTPEMTEEEGKKFAEGLPSLNKAYSSLKAISLDPKQRKLYEYAEKARMTYDSDMDAAMEKGMEKGEEKGMEKGKEIGRKEGEEKGMERGKEIGRKEGEEKGMERGRKVILEQLLNQGVLNQDQLDSLMEDAANRQ